MKILFVSSEAAPFVKTGGLADVAGALPRTLRAMGHDVRLLLPRYADLNLTGGQRLLPIMPEMKVTYGSEIIAGAVLRCSFPGSDMPVYFIDELSFSQRKGIYGSGNTDFADNDRRFSFFNMATLWMLKGLDWQPDIIHLNDWQTGLLPVLLRNHPLIAHDPFFQPIRTIFAIHNMAYQGNFDKFLVPQIGLPWSVFTQDGMEFYGRASFLKSGIVFSDQLVTVSPSYAREIQTTDFGAGMDGTLRLRGDRLHGILNGIDCDEWNPETDKHLNAHFTADDLSGKAVCKRDLQKLGGFPEDPKVPVIGIISRLVEQKGFSLITEVLEQMLELNAQYYLLGSGNPAFEEAFVAASASHPDRFHIKLGYDVPLSHRIIAGSDLFLVPSLFEPCGLTQMYAMRYGTVPVVRRTGGLADTVREATPNSIEAGTGNGFLFEEPSSDAFMEALKRAIDAYHAGGAAWQKLQRNGMKKDLSWNAAGDQYARLYTAAAKEEPYHHGRTI